MAPSMTTRTTIVLELQSNTTLFATVRINKAGQKEYVNPLRTRDPVMYVNCIDGETEGCLGRWDRMSRALFLAST
jgi:hypothetical protein